MNARTRSFFAAAIGLTLMALTTGLAPTESETTAPPRAELDKPAPDFSLPDTKGQQRSLADFKGRIVVLEWINPECPYVQRHYRQGSMQRACQHVKRLDKSAAWLAVNSTSGATAARMRFWIDQHKIEYPILLDADGAVGRLYDARTTPHMFVIDKQGVLRYHGAIDDNALGATPKDQVTNYVVNAVKQLVNDEVVAPNLIKPYGCSIKYKSPSP